MIDQTHELDPAFMARLREIREQHRRETCPREPELGCAEAVTSGGITFCRLMGDECVRADGGQAVGQPLQIVLQSGCNLRRNLIQCGWRRENGFSGKQNSIQVCA